MYSFEDYFGVSPTIQAGLDRASPQAPNFSALAGERPAGRPGTLAAFTDWRRSPVFWLAVFAVLALGLIHAEVKVSGALR